ncbi:hypothetical protein [Vibrio nigripulchritudo]|uniref:hypothetical protein n=1 Tax=Vibrio nigripulchritudo TaxID=28173 RepID=UPI0003B18FB0|nr:hypothetical protein [Vibrio nigripulchritudo]CCN69767.1 conserved hypothetical protein [Vibrio nigripulchritudo SFn118]
MSLLTIAATALELGPMAIRGIASLFGGSETAEKVAKTVEAANQEFSKQSDKVSAVNHVLEKMTPQEKAELLSLQVEMEKEVTERQRIAAEDKQAEHRETQTTIRAGDGATDKVVRWSRPLMAMISACSASYYLIVTPNPDLTVATLLLGLGATYMGLRHREKGKGIV